MEYQVRRRRSRWIWFVLAAVGVVLLFNLAVRFGGAYLVRRKIAQVSEQIGEPISVGWVRSRLGTVSLGGIAVGPEGKIAKIGAVDLKYPISHLLWLRVNLSASVRDAEFKLGDALFNRPHRASGGGSGGRVRILGGEITRTRIRYTSEKFGFTAQGQVSGRMTPQSLKVQLTGIAVSLPGGLEAGVEEVGLVRSAGQLWPRVEIRGGHFGVSLVALSDIAGTIVPRVDGTLDVSLGGSYGGAGQRLWDASGTLRPSSRQVDLHVRAERFRLGQLEALKKWPVADLTDTELGWDLRVQTQEEALTFRGSFGISGLTINSGGLAVTPVPNLSAELSMRGRLSPGGRTLVLEDGHLRFRQLSTLFDVRVEKIGEGPQIRAHMRVPPVGCQALLASIPAELVPTLAGMRLGGSFDAEVNLGVDLGALESVRASGEWKRNRKLLEGPVELGGRVALAGCRIVEAPPEVDTRRLLHGFVHSTEMTPGHFATFVVGPENPDYVPLTEISPHVIASILTTEDSRFFDHHGFIPREIRSALARDLVEKRFAYGASSITMQMVKNVLLTREKTLSRKLQEVILTWYVENTLPKDRILEIYLNAIEFGPGIFGIGRAARHYFGKSPRDLTPLEAAFFSSILPSPKRRYEHYCRGKLSARWEKYLPRILRRMHERGRLSDEEYAAALAQPFQFDRAEAKSERECLELVKRWVGATAEEPLDELELPFHEEPFELDTDSGVNTGSSEPPAQLQP